MLYDGDALVAEYNTAGTLLRRYVHGPAADADDPLAWFESTSAASGNARHLYADPRGSIVLVGDSAGRRIAIKSYDEYGIPDSGGSVATEIATKGRFQYTGQIWLPMMGVYYYKARMYSPTLGRFMQTDPIGYEDQVNLYGYAGNDPVNGVDPSGTQACDGEKGCIEASNFKADKSDGKTVTQSEKIDSAVTAQLPSIETEHSPDERVMAFDEASDGSVNSTEVAPNSQSERGGTIETKATIPNGTDAVGHSHPNEDSTIAPGNQDEVL